MSEVEVNKKVDEWFKKTVVEDAEDCLSIGNDAMEECRKHWNIGFGNPETVLGFYSTVFGCILDKLVSKREKNSAFAINVADVVEIGFDDSTDDGVSEKVGNFCPYIYDLGKKMSYDDNPDRSSIERCTEWASKSITEQRKTLDEIASDSVKHLHEDLNLELAASSAIFPLFCTIHERVVGHMKVKLADINKPEAMINFCNNYDIYARTGENGESIIEYSPKPMQKLAVKSDSQATSEHEG